MKYLFFILFFITSPLYAQRKAEEVVKENVDVEVEVNPKIDLSKIKDKRGRQENVCGSNSSLAFSLVGNLHFPPFSWTVATPRKNNENIMETKLHGIGVAYFIHLLDKTFKNFYYSNNIIVKTNEEIDKAMLRGSADIYVNAYYDNSPSSGFDYIFPSYLTNNMIIIQRKDNPNISITSLEDLKNYKGVVREEDNTNWIYKKIDINLTSTDKVIEVTASKESAKEALTLLLKGDVDYFLSNIYSARAEIGRYKLYEELEINSRNILVMNRLFFAVSKLSSCRNFKKEIDTSLNKELFNTSDLRIIVLSNIKEYINLHKNEPKLIVPKNEALKTEPEAELEAEPKPEVKTTETKSEIK